MEETKCAELLCSRCGAPFHCGRNDPESCWCAQLPPLPVGALEAGRGCVCRACLEAQTATRPARHV
jgi:hypothetical protein